jgi:DHA2 family multidrug resistance protein
VRTGEIVEDSAANWKPRFNPWVIALTVTLATFMEVLDTSIANVALPHIAGGLSAGMDESTWVLTSYLVANAVILPISAWIADRVGRKRFYMSCVALFTISSFMCGLAPTLPILIFFRVLQGMGGGGLAPSEQAILADTFEPKKRGMAFAVYGMAVVMAPAIGPTLGGYITDNLSWRWIFYINVPIGIFSLLLTQRIVEDPPYLKEAARRSKNFRIDYVGLGLVTVGLGALQVVLDKGQEDDWFGSPLILAFTIIAVVGLLAFVFWEWQEQHPIVNLRLFKNRGFAISNFLMFCLGATLYSTTVLIPQFLQVIMGYTAERSGEVLTPGAFVIILLLPLVGRLVGRVDARYLISFGFAVLGLSMLHMTSLYPGVDFGTATMYRVYQCMGLAFLFVPINTVAYLGVPANENNQVSGMINLMRNVGGSVGISSVTTLLARRSQLHQSNLVGGLDAGNLGLHSFINGLGQRLSMGGAGAYGGTLQSYGRLYQMVAQQAAVLAYDDVIWLCAVVCLGLVPLVFLLEKSKAETVQAGH